MTRDYAVNGTVIRMTDEAADRWNSGDWTEEDDAAARVVTPHEWHQRTRCIDGEIVDVGEPRVTGGELITLAEATERGMDLGDGVTYAVPVDAPVVSLSDIYDAMRKCYQESFGDNLWHAVTVHADGEIVVRTEVSPCYSNAEYNREGRPHPVTVWSTYGDTHTCDEDDTEAALESFDPEEQLAGDGGVKQLRRTLAEAGFVVEE